MTKEYIGDSVYVDFDGYGLTLTTENGLGASNTIYLEPNVYQSLVEYVASLEMARKNSSGAECDTDPSGCWIDDETGEHVNAATGTRSAQHPAAECEGAAI